METTPHFSVLKFFAVMALCGVAAFLCVSHANGETPPRTKKNAPGVIAHRGHWKKAGAARNSISALRNAQQLGVYGTEFDVWLTVDEVPVVNHDPKIGKTKPIVIEQASRAELADVRLENGEPLPTLDEYLAAGARDKRTRLILEIKPHSTPERDRRAAAVVVALVDARGAAARTEYISFSREICRELRRLRPAAPVAYLGGDLPPAEVKALGLTGIDYSAKVFGKNPEWIAAAKEIGLTVNVWTVNEAADMERCIAAGVDFITTDEPERLLEILRRGGAAGI